MNPFACGHGNIKIGYHLPREPSRQDGPPDRIFALGFLAKNC